MRWLVFPAYLATHGVLWAYMKCLPEHQPYQEIITINRRLRYHLDEKYDMYKDIDIHKQQRDRYSFSEHLHNNRSIARKQYDYFRSIVGKDDSIFTL
jgi:hypothetical protein